ncbi:prolipoprotein diacylglyceryl transferase [Wenyingzhuangia heitensis]|uniref:Phosphatidylglycerol--prolipoprotein diacylglyceryl transferase n=1 Tax=Wenyingzhuangia heitensis TaxID=1487859 RepID=A0ABX0U9F8_9FLAO|nr:prolipoprotein diacylglyceryl transferase [Wenyingzhuangia heitensis]NIJ45472.1 prolipoprotein diacylglyceryl transferase [Wenyingzhuangia heitensis]
MNLLAITWDPSLGLDLGFFVIRYYSLMFVIAFALGYQIMKKIFIYENIELEKLDKLLMYVVFATILGARLGHVFFYDWAYFSQHPEEILLPFKFRPEFRFTGFAGLASHGAAIGIIASLWYFSKKILQKPLLYVLDRVSLTIASGGVFVRLGNLMNSEIIGHPTGTDYGFIFKALGEDFPRHPTQLYESFGYLMVFAIIFYMFWKTNAKEKLGLIFGVFFTLLWSVRFVVEFFKEAQVDDRASWALNTGQWLSIPLILIGIYFVIQAKKK